MKTVVIALYKKQLPGWGSHAVFDRLSRFVGGKREGLKWVPGKYSHAELVIPLNGGWMSLSSSFRDGGVRFKEIDFNDDNWDYIKIKKTDQEIQTIIDKFTLIIGCKYDWPSLGVFLFGKAWPLDIKWWFFCSEVVALLLNLNSPKNWHPCHLVSLGEVTHTIGKIPNDD